MRNFKRVLSLALAVVMVIGMMVMGAGAAPLTDESEIKYLEAVEVSRALEIIDGLPNGAFNPKGELTREGAAILVCRLVMGRENADKLVGVNGFADVAPSWYSAGYIEWCANNGYVGGFPDGKFYPTLPMVTYGFGKLLLCALGYDAEIEGYGSAAAIQEDMISAGIAVKGVDASATLTREVAAQMILQTLQAKLVKYTGGMNITTSDGTSIKVGAEMSNYDDNGADYDLVSATDTSDALLFVEKYYPALLKVTGTPDAFGRTASHKWIVDVDDNDDYTPAKDVVAYNSMVPASYTVDVTGAKNDTLAEIAEELELDLNGKTGTYAKGDTVEIYVDRAGKITNTVVLHTELAKVTKVTKTTDADALYTYVVTVSVGGSVRNYKDTALKGFDADTMVKDTYITIVENTGKTAAVVALADSITGKQTAKGTGYTKIDGVKKEYAGDVWYVNDIRNDYTNTYDVYVDAKGYVIGTVKVAGAKAETNVFYIDEAKFAEGTTWTSDAAKISVVHLDGEEEILNVAITVKQGVKYVTVDGEKALGANASDLSNIKGFYKYTMNAEGDVATLTAVGFNTSAAGETFAYLYDGKKVTFTEGKANVQWWGTTFYADEATTVTTIQATGTKTVTGYKNFLGKVFTAGAGVNALVEFDGDAVKAIYILGAGFAPVADDAVIGVYVSTGDTYKVLGVEYKDVVYNVAGENVTYRVASGATTYAFAEIEVTNGVAALANASSVTADNAVTKVADSYILVDGSAAPVYFAKEVAYYDVTNVAKNGVLADDGIVVGDVIRYTTDDYGKIDAIYTTFTAKEDGTIAINLGTAAGEAYYTDVLGLNPAALDSFTADTMYAVIQYTRPANSGSKTFTFKFWNVETPASTTTWNLNAGWNPAASGVLLSSSSSADAGVYNYEISFDGAVIQAGAFELG